MSLSFQPLTKNEVIFIRIIKNLNQMNNIGVCELLENGNLFTDSIKRVVSYSYPTWASYCRERKPEISIG